MSKTVEHMISSAKAPSPVMVAGRTAHFIRRHPVILTPFAGLALIYSGILAAAFLAPQPPFSVVFSPLIRAFWGEQFLHYPVNLMLLPRLFDYGKCAADLFLGITMTGIAVSLILQAHEGVAPDWWTGIQRAGRRYLRLIGVWSLTLACALLAVKLASFTSFLTGSRKFVFAAELLSAAAVQMVFVFAVPAIIIENRKITVSVARSVALLKRYPFATAALVVIPNLLLFPVLYIEGNPVNIVERMLPEAVLYLLSFRIAAVIAADCAITAASTVLLLAHREYEKGKPL